MTERRTYYVSGEKGLFAVTTLDAGSKEGVVHGTRPTRAAGQRLAESMAGRKLEWERMSPEVYKGQ